MSPLKHALPVRANEAPTNPGFLRKWIQMIHGDSSGQIAVCSPLSWRGQFFPAAPDGFDAATKYAAWLTDRGVPGIYLRMTSIDPARIQDDDGHKRGPVEASVSLPCLWADLDIAGPNHKHVPNIPGEGGYDPSKLVLLHLPPDEDAASEILFRAALPKPTWMIHSGGGLYPIWRFQEPVDLTDPAWMERAKAASEGLQRLIGWAAGDLGWHYGTGVSDLARVLRLPGTRNRKVPDSPAWCYPLFNKGYDNGGEYHNFEELEALIQANLEDLVTTAGMPQPAAPTAPAIVTTEQWSTGAGPTPRDSDTPLNRLEAELSWSQILEPAGWQIHHTDPNGTVHWTRPGKERRDGTSATTGHAGDRDRMFCFSDAAGLPIQQSMTKAYVYAQLNYGGDLHAAAQAWADRTRAREDGVTLVPREQVYGEAPAAPERVDGSRSAVARGQAAPVAPQAEGEHPWQPPRPLSSEPQFAPFPVDALPDPVRNMVTGVADHLQVDPTLAATYALGTLSALAAPRLAVQNTAHRWVEPLNLYLMASLPPGERKSPAMRPFTNPLRQIERRMAAEHEEQIQLKIHERRTSGDSLSGDPVKRNALEDDVAKLEEELQSPPQVTIAPDATSEAVVAQLAANGGCGAIIDSEGAIAATWAGRYTNGKAAGLEAFLQGYDGDRFRLSRVGRGNTTIERPILTVCCATQPTVVGAMSSNLALMERGLLDRFMWVFPKASAGTRDVTRVCPISEQVEYEWAALLDRISRIEIPEDALSTRDMPAMVLSPGAYRVFTAWHQGIEDQCGPKGRFGGAMRGWASKHPGRALRLAGVLHLAGGEDNSSEVSEETMVNALKIASWCIDHAQRFFEGIVVNEDDATPEQCQEVMDKLDKKEVTSITPRQLKTMIQARWATRERLSDAIDTLLEHGFLREGEYRDRNNRIRPILMVNPYRIL